MKFEIIETGKIEELVIRDSDTNIEYTQDLLGNVGALAFNSEKEIYVLSQADYDWWNAYIANHMSDDEEAKELGIVWDDYAEEFNADMDDEHMIKQSIIARLK